jgi:NAD(P)-dependent dehydrogenase (short-subunit alcohol dehydrogenase family)
MIPTENVRINAVCPGTIETPMVDQMVANSELDVGDTESGPTSTRYTATR